MCIVYVLRTVVGLMCIRCYMCLDLDVVGLVRVRLEMRNPGRGPLLVTFVYVCVYVYMYVCIYIYMYIYTHVCIYIYIYIYICMYIYIHTYTCYSTCDIHIYIYITYCYCISTTRAPRSCPPPSRSPAAQRPSPSSCRSWPRTWR